ncbi:hypothetical protein L1D14_03770 [Vibrio tubiashii]|uniref:hypothetical protein n=1 Tax=Vibrio tubiashii TaxID=29498 RepID=UPI001EFC72A7|nr:hypothetical protein [Vibrio tubiashii]MCG9575348.1 hypothetical protein [Vibrio tubiashii]
MANQTALLKLLNIQSELGIKITMTRSEFESESILERIKQKLGDDTMSPEELDNLALFLHGNVHIVDNG